MNGPLTRTLVVVGLVVAAWSALAVGAKAEYRARTTADEPQYLLSALSLWEDRDLDIADELAAERWRAWHDAGLPEQTRELEGGSRVSPHDPLLPVLLAVPVGLGGWLGAKLALAGLAGVLAAATVWVAVRRFAVRVPVAVGVVVALSVVPPLAAYGTQVYPELPAALAVVAAVGALTGSLHRRGLAVVAVALVALPWLSVKYAPVVVALAGVAAWRLVADRRWRAVTGLGAWGAANAVAFAVVHQLIYTGWTPYAAGDHFVEGQLTVMGRDPDHLDRSVRLLGLLVDRSFGLAAWAPAFLLAVAALGALVRRRPSGWAALVVPLAAAWLNATFLALTMHGWWWPGRQVVVAVPLAVVAVAWWCDRVGRPALVALGALTLAGVASWLGLLAEVYRGERALILDFYETAALPYRWWATLLPDGLRPGDDTGLVALWLGLVAALAVAGWHSLPAHPIPPTPYQEPPTPYQAKEHTHADPPTSSHGARPRPAPAGAGRLR
ncbi:MAG: hypothetical protein MUF83_12040 [Acidimicrobiales bacterium]|nr:hypothetical protein [Acidimicrobiales bacterium]